MSDNDDDNNGRQDRVLYQFPIPPDEEADQNLPFVDLGITPLAKQLGLTSEQMNGHWCSRCQGIWFGYTLEAECPVCGNRHG